MPSLTRQRMPQSLHSEWSRSYLGVTISIHAMAKPLMKLMYHRAVLDLIKQQQGIPPSAETMQIYESYLVSKYVAETTKVLILRELEDRARFEAEARVVAHFLLVYDMLLDSADVTVRRWTCWILAALAFHSSTRGAVVAVHPCARLLALSGDADVNVVKAACYAVSQISRDQDGATPLVEAGAPEFLKQLLESQDTDAAVVAVQPGARLAALLSDGNLKVVKGACFAVSQISRNLDDAIPVVEARAPEILNRLLESQDRDVRGHSCWALGQLAVHSSTRAAVVTVQLVARLVALLSDADVKVVRGACFAVSQISRNLDGATLVVEARAPEFLKQLLESQDTDLQRHACWALGRLALHSSTQTAVVAVQPSAPLLALLRDGNTKVMTDACYALVNLALSQAGARDLTQAGVLDLVPELIKSRQVHMRRFTCLLLAQLAHHNRIPP
ncbi:armadillo-type protein [Mycena metata]|uniref:Armadillo-type protein n=1 Tax=Mycena metata TaxID=1033252 RepID=A0AAD7HZH2_9AGAR|nr:armadillo-type protein [Mycena metata]